jgi:hypothetical protein
VLKYVPMLEQAFRVRKRRVGGSWRMDKTYVRIRGKWKYLHRAVDKAGNTVDFLLTETRRAFSVVSGARMAYRWFFAVWCWRASRSRGRRESTACLTGDCGTFLERHRRYHAGTQSTMSSTSSFPQA